MAPKRKAAADSLDEDVNKRQRQGDVSKHLVSLFSFFFFALACWIVSHFCSYNFPFCSMSTSREHLVGIGLRPLALSARMVL